MIWQSYRQMYKLAPFYGPRCTAHTTGPKNPTLHYLHMPYTQHCTVLKPHNILFILHAELWSLCILYFSLLNYRHSALWFQRTKLHYATAYLAVQLFKLQMRMGMQLKIHQSQPNIYIPYFEVSISSRDLPGRTVLFSVDDRSPRTRPSYQVDQGSCTYPQGRSSSYESRRGQLSVESRLRPLS